MSKPKSDLYRKHLGWAKANLPNEYGPFVAVAYGMIVMTGQTPTKEKIQDRLLATGRDRAACFERHRRYRG